MKRKFVRVEAWDRVHMNSCLLSRLRTSLNAWLTIVAFLGGVLAAAALITLGTFIASLLSAPIVTPAIAAALASSAFSLLIPLAAVLVSGALLLAIGFLINDILQCFVFSNLPPPPTTQTPPAPLTGVPDCEKAKRNADAARAAALAAEQAVNDQAARVRRAQDQLNAARSALSAATVALGASFLVPWLLLPVLAAMVASAFAVTTASKNLAKETQLLTNLAAILAKKLQELSESETIAGLACSTPLIQNPSYILALPMIAASAIIGISPPPLQPPAIPNRPSPGNTD